MGKGKKKGGKSVKTNGSLPGVSCCCPTMLKRGHFLNQTIHLFKQQDYEGDMELFIFCDDFSEGGNDSDDNPKSLFLKTIEDARAGLKKNQSIRVLKSKNKLVLGEKRQIMATDPQLKDIIAWWDDDDFFYPTRVSYSVKRLTSDKSLRAVGCSAQEIFFSTLCQFSRVEAMKNPFHATCGTIMMYSKLFKDGNEMEAPPLTFQKGQGFAEEKHMLKEYSVKLAQLDPSKVIMIVSHGSTNTVAKEQLVNRPNLTQVTSTGGIEKMIKTFTKKDHQSTKFYMSLIKMKEDQGESAQWRKYRDSGRQDIFYIDGKHLDHDSTTYKRLNGLL